MLSEDEIQTLRFVANAANWLNNFEGNNIVI